MATAAVISFEEARQTRAKTRARQQLHEHLDRWWDRLEAHVPDDTPSLEALTQAVFGLRQELTGRITETLVEQSHTRRLQQRTRCCPNCTRYRVTYNSPQRPNEPSSGTPQSREGPDPRRAPQNSSARSAPPISQID